MHAHDKVALQSRRNGKLEIIGIIIADVLYPLEIDVFHQFHGTQHYLRLPAETARLESIAGDLFIAVVGIPEIMDTPHRHADVFPYSLDRRRMHHIRIGQRRGCIILHVEILHPAVGETVARTGKIYFI